METYAWPLSATAGEVVSVFMSTQARRFSFEVARVGVPGEIVSSVADVVGREQPVPGNAYEVGAGWVPSVKLRVDPEWPSGYYEIRCIDSDGATGTGFFVVRGGQAGSALPLLVLSTSTYNAYNNWGGASLYDGAATRVSFGRPVPKGFLGKPESRDGRFANVSGEDDILGVRGTAWCAAQGVSPYSLSAGWDNWERRFVDGPSLAAIASSTPSALIWRPIPSS